MSQGKGCPHPRRPPSRNPIVGVPCLSEGRNTFDLSGKPSSPLIVGVGDLRPFGPVEQLPFCSVILFHRAVKVEMVAGKVRKERPGEARAGDALQLYPVRGNFHDYPANALFEHLGERTLHLHGLGGRASRRTALPAGDGLRRRHQAALPGPVSPGQDAVQSVGGRSLTVGPGDTVDFHASRRVPVDGAGESGEGDPRV